MDAPNKVDRSYFEDYGGENLPMRGNNNLREDASHIELTGHKEEAGLTGESWASYPGSTAIN